MSKIFGESVSEHSVIKDKEKEKDKEQKFARFGLNARQVLAATQRWQLRLLEDGPTLFMLASGRYVAHVIDASMLRCRQALESKPGQSFAVKAPGARCGGAGRVKTRQP